MPPLPDFPRLPPVRQSAMHHQGRWNAVASCHAQTSRSSSVVRITEITGLNECQIDQVPRAISWSRLGLCGFVSAECSPMLLAGEQAPLSSPRRRHNGHGRTCHWFGPVANGPKRSFCLEQTSCEQFDIASDQSPMVSVTGRGGYCHECRQKTLARQGKERVFG